MLKPSGLGKGLGALIPKKFIKNEEEKEIAQKLEHNLADIEVEKISTNPHQPRRDFSEDELQELVESIREHGIITPLILTRKEEGGYELIAGERRLRAARILSIQRVPAIIRSAKEQEKLELALIENIQRKDLNPLEQAWAYKKLTDDFNLTQEETAKRVGKSRPTVTNTLRLLELPEEIQRALMENKISEGHAKALLSLETAEAQLQMLRTILEHHLTVRQVEDAAKRARGQSPKLAHISIDVHLKEKERRLEEFFGTKVNIAKHGKGGKIIIEYYSEEELHGILEKIV